MPAMGIPLAMALSILGYKVFDEAFEAIFTGPRSERLQKTQLGSQTKIASAGMEGQRRAMSESRESTRRYMDQLLALERERSGERREGRREAALFGSQDRQMAMLMAALQTLGQRDVGSSPSSGMVAALRGM